MKITLVICVAVVCLFGAGLLAGSLWVDKRVEIGLAEKVQPDTTNIDRTIEWVVQKNLLITPMPHEFMGFVVIRYRGKEFLATTRGGICLIE